MSSTYTPNPAHTPATSTLPSDGDALNVASIIGAIKDALDLAANARLNAAKTNVDNNFSTKQTMAELESLGVARFDAVISSKTPDTFTATRVPIQFVGSGVNGHPPFYVYMANTDTVEFVFNATWDEVNSEWDRDHTLGRTTRFAFSKSGLVVQSYNGASDTITESDWTSVIDFSLPSNAKGKVFGALTNSLLGWYSTDIREDLKTVGVSGTVPYLNSWGPGTGRTVGFFKDHSGVVHLQGRVTSASGGAIFALPSGYRPSAEIWVVTTINAFGASNLFSLQIKTNGEVSVNSSATELSLDGINFLAD